jgi:hypothetical protein
MVCVNRVNGSRSYDLEETSRTRTSIGFMTGCISIWNYCRIASLPSAGKMHGILPIIIFSTLFYIEKKIFTHRVESYK